jgi:hypothetical protein
MLVPDAKVLPAALFGKKTHHTGSLAVNELNHRSKKILEEGEKRIGF